MKLYPSWTSNVHLLSLRSVILTCQSGPDCTTRIFERNIYYSMICDVTMMMMMIFYFRFQVSMYVFFCMHEFYAFKYLDQNRLDFCLRQASFSSLDFSSAFVLFFQKNSFQIRLKVLKLDVFQSEIFDVFIREPSDEANEAFMTRELDQSCFLFFELGRYLPPLIFTILFTAYFDPPFLYRYT